MFEMSYAEIYQEARQTQTAQQAARWLLDCMTGGTCAAWDSGRLNLSLLAIIKKFEGRQ